jgi:hypothetical protein
MFVAVLFFANTAFACPACAGNEEWNMNSFIVTAVMVLLPFAVVATCWFAVKRIIVTTAAGESSGEEIG